MHTYLQKKVSFFLIARDVANSFFIYKVRYITARATVLPAQTLETINMADLSGVMGRCSETDLEGHDNRVSFSAWNKKRGLLATWYKIFLMLYCLNVTKVLI